MEIAQRPSTTGLSTRATANPAAGQAENTPADASAAIDQAVAPKAPAPLRRGLSNMDAPLQNDVSGAQQAIDFLEQSAAQLRALKTDIAAKLATRTMRDGQVEQRVRQFSETWRNRTQASGGTLDAQLNYSNQPATQRFTVRGMTLANLRNGARETWPSRLAAAPPGCARYTWRPACPTPKSFPASTRRWPQPACASR